MIWAREAEESLLAAAMNDEAVIDAVPLTAEDFYLEANAEIWRALLRVRAEGGDHTDPAIVADNLRRNDVYTVVGGIDRLIELVDAYVTSANVNHYAEMVRERARARRFASVTEEVWRKLEGGAVLEDLVGEVDAALCAAIDKRTRRDTTAGGLVMDTVERISAWQEGRAVAGASTGYRRLDWITRGLRPGAYWILAGRPSMGKSALGRRVATFTAAGGTPTLFISAEMTADQLVELIISDEASVPAHKFSDCGALSDEEQKRVAMAAGRVAQLPLRIEDEDVFRVADIRQKARQAKRDMGGLGLIVVDYIQYLEGDGENRTAEVTKQSRAMKQLAKELHCTVLVISQLNRGNEMRGDKRPVLSDLRDSGALEQDGDIIMLIHRPGYYSDQRGDAGEAELAVAKNRTGPVGFIRLWWEPQYTRFTEVV